jgi:protein TonB
MILIFDVMAYLGTSSPRAVAAGVSTATITTMAGMVGALSGIFPAAWLSRAARVHQERLRNGQVPAFIGQGRAPGVAARGLRMAVVPAVAAAVTVGLLFLMEQLIVTGQEALTGSARSYLVDFVRIEREETLTRRERKPDKIPPPEEAPITPPPSPADSQIGDGLAIRAPTAPGMEVKVSAVGSGFGVSDSELMPIYKIAPVYPRSAAQRGLEGWVMVRFTVTAIGAVRDVEVVESSHKVFERAAMAAAAKFKFRPRLINGDAVEVTNVYNKIIFALDQKS